MADSLKKEPQKNDCEQRLIHFVRFQQIIAEVVINSVTSARQLLRKTNLFSQNSCLKFYIGQRICENYFSILG